MPYRNALQHNRTRHQGIPDTTSLPIAIGDLWGWYSGDGQPGLTDAAAVNTLYDQSGNGHHGTPGANVPIYKVNIVNGKPVIRFSGVNYYYRFYGGIGNPVESTFFLVWSRANAANSDVVFLEWLGGSYSYLQYGITWYFGGGGSFNLAQAAGTFFLKCGKYTGSNVVCYTNGTQSNTAVNSAKLLIPGIGAAGYGFSADVAEFLVYSRALSDTDRQLVETYLNAKYALW